MSDHHERVRFSWRHAVCDLCWAVRFFATRGEPMRSHDDEPPVPCCFCAATTGSGISVRHNPDGLFCRGMHEEE